VIDVVVISFVLDSMATASRKLGNGCTSGHGVCGLGRQSLRSLVAVITFMATAIATTYVSRRLGGLA
jgi:uncharacterized membrane protein YedE/YeeE